MWILAVYILTFIVGFPANVFTFIILLAKARRRVSPSDLLLLNLTAADLLLLLFLPFKMAEAAADMTWPLPPVLCPLANFVFYSSIYISSLFLAALSVQRYLGVVFPHQYKARRRPCRVVAASVALWFLAGSLCSVVFVAQYHGGRNPLGVNRWVVIITSWATGPRLVALAFKGLTRHRSPVASSPVAPSSSSPECSITDGFVHRSSSISSSGGPNPGGFKISSPGGSNPGGFRISRPGGPNPGGFRISSPAGPNPGGSQIFHPDSSISLTSPFLDSSSPSHGPQPAFSSSSSSSSSSPPDVPRGPTTFKCYDDFSKDQLLFVLPLRLTLFLLLFLLPFGLTVFCYVNFVRVLLARPNIPLEKKQRAVGLAVATMVNFGVCFAPYNISHLVGFLEKKSPQWRVYVLLLTSLNAALDPVIFYFSSRAVQKAMKGVVVALGGKLRVVVGWWHKA
ncbi:FFAR2 protein, partial [Jacana jacana]|nr:FFAR2 protein [Jacana jacana]